VELHNRGNHAVDVGYWRFVDGIDFMIPPGTLIPAGGYLTVARDRANLLTKYAQLDAANTVGDYAGELSDRGERVGYSLSAIVREAYTNSFLGMNALAGLLACLVVGALVARRTPFLGHRLPFDAAAWLTVTLGLQISLIHYQWGLLMVGFVPDLSASFKAYLDLIQLMVICFLTVPFLIAAAFFASDDRGYAG
jgi:hypothetical protein